MAALPSTNYQESQTVAHHRYILLFRRLTSHNGDYILSFIRLITLLGRSGYQEIKVFFYVIFVNNLVKPIVKCPLIIEGHFLQKYEVSQ